MCHDPQSSYDDQFLSSSKGRNTVHCLIFLYYRERGKKKEKENLRRDPKLKSIFKSSKARAALLIDQSSRNEM